MYEKYYYSIDVPVLYKPFSELTSEEAEEYFSSFMGAIDGRVQALEVISRVELDYSKSSLAELWRWFLSEAVTEEAPVPKKKKRKFWQRKTQESAPEPPKNGGLRFTLDTECALWDIAVYFGEVLVREHPTLEWGYRADGPHANMPVIMGFCDPSAPEGRTLDPFSATQEEADRIFSGTQNEDDLYRLCQEWDALAPSN